MKRISAQSATAVALVAALGVSLPAVAYANSGSRASTNHISTSHSATATSPAWKAFQTSRRIYRDGLKSIRVNYRASVKSARAAYVDANAAATTRAERQAALTTFDNAVAVALNARVAATIATGDPPAPPAGYNGTTWVTAVQAANLTLRSSLSAARTTYAHALVTATTRIERRTARLTFEAARDSAHAARSAALRALGARPADSGQLA